MNIMSDNSFTEHAAILQVLSGLSNVLQEHLLQLFQELYSCYYKIVFKQSNDLAGVSQGAYIIFLLTNTALYSKAYVQRLQ